MITNTEIDELTKEIRPVFKKVEGMEIKNAKDMEGASVVLSLLNRCNDKVKEKKEGVTKPLNTALKAARELFKPLEEELEEAIASVKVEMIAYQSEAKRKADLEASKIEARIGEGRGKLQFDTAVAKIEAIEKPENKVITGVGSVTFVTVQRFEVTNLASVPVDYILPNEVAIRNAMKLGKKVPGVRYFEEQIPRNSR